MQSRPLLLLTLTTLAATTAAAAAAEMPPPYTITVSGEASVQAVADSATIEAGVTSRAKTAHEASAATSEAMQRIVSALHGSGIADRDVRTQYVSLQPIQESDQKGSSHVVGFRATNSLTVTVRDISQVGGVLDRLIAAGANVISGIGFDVSARSQRLDAARTDAVRDARRKAEVLAKAAGVSVGPAIDIVEGGESTPVMMRAAAAAPAPIMPGEQTLRASVRVTFELMH